MKNIIKIVILSVIINLLFIFAAYSQSAVSVLESGKYVFIPSPPDCELFLDNVLQGTTPILLSNLEDGGHMLEIRSSNKVNRQDILVDGGITGITSFVPVMEYYSGMLSVNSFPEGAEVWIDDENAGKTPLEIDSIRTGLHSVQIKKESYAVTTKEILINWDEQSRVSEILNQGFDIKINPIPPEGSRIIVKDEDERIYTDLIYPAEIILPEGAWEISISGLNFLPAKNKVIVEDEDKIVVFEYKPYYGEFVFNNLSDTSIVMLDNENITIDIKDGKYPVAAGPHLIMISDEGFLPYIRNFIIFREQELLISAQLQKDLVYERKLKGDIGIPAVVSGIVLAAGGLILNLDDISMGLTSNYNDYSILKYSSLGIIGSGLIVSAVGGFLLFDTM